MTQQATIAVGVDGSWADNGAVDWALQESRLSSDPVRVLHVIDNMLPAGPFVDMARADEAAKRLVADARDYLHRNDAEAEHTAVVLSGAPAHTLAGATAGDRMLVVGRHGRGVLGRLLIGSTAEAVAHFGGTALVVVPPKWRPGDQVAPVAVGVDELERCEAAVAFAVGLAAERGVRIRLVHVWDVAKMYTGDTAATAGTVELARRHHNEQLDAIAQQCRDKYPNITFETELRHSHPVAGLTDATQEADAQLLVIGGRSHRRLTAILLGSTARGVLQHAAGPIAIVHQPLADH
ncbi:nucleotide-binding universal stress UspA family protein [Kribbella orskensis]|uniref:Nucleotide-binding universal stress UspA family protein n=1 Tax=Kribbella orskensis TaxID=2512216 RepID=A0ABY2B8D5_9ACTN|nr:MULTISPECIES: universal stress protein [Kribbella]TCN31132.1 nucleotide-binding universal stress UspA family protein [Kribbella sp. VKM Ac-2500]TCO11638.1 nucleotide-binding universal stress UspA family protein [Kribbella orskensis]